MRKVEELTIKLSELYEFIHLKKAKRIGLVNKIVRRHLKNISKKSEKINSAEYVAEAFGIGGKPTKKERKTIIKKARKQVKG